MRDKLSAADHALGSLEGAVLTLLNPDLFVSLQVADYWLIAHALADGHVVVTHEVPADSVKRIKIPNACIGLNLRFMTRTECCAGNGRDLF